MAQKDIQMQEVVGGLNPDPNAVIGGEGVPSGFADARQKKLTMQFASDDEDGQGNQRGKVQRNGVPARSEDTNIGSCLPLQTQNLNSQIQQNEGGKDYVIRPQTPASSVLDEDDGEKSSSLSNVPQVPEQTARFSGKENDKEAGSQKKQLKHWNYQQSTQPTMIEPSSALSDDREGDFY